MRASFAAVWVIGIALAGCSTDPAGGQDADSTVTETDSVTETDVEEDTGDVVETEPTDTGVVETTDTGEPPDTTPAPRAFPSEGFVVRITSPSGSETADSAGAIVQIGGVLFGEAEALVWQLGNQSGTMTPGKFWNSGPINLVPGDNRITVTASRTGASTTDAIIVTYSPSFRFDTPLLTRPASAWNGTASEVFFTVAQTLFSNVVPNTTRLLRVTETGTVLEDLGRMVDDGTLNSSGDEIDADGVFTLRTTVTCDAATPKFYRASVEIDAAQNYTAVSPIVRFDCLEHVLVGDCSAHQTLIEGAATMLADGGTKAEVVAWLESDASVAVAGMAEADGTSLWVQFKDGILGAVLSPDSGRRGGAGEPASGAEGGLPNGVVVGNVVDVASKRAIVLAPFASDFGDTDDASLVAASLLATQCPAYSVAGGGVLANTAASLQRFRTLSSYGVASISTHGDALFGGVPVADMRGRYRWRHVGPQEVIWSGSPVACEALLQTTETCTISTSATSDPCPLGSRCLVTQGTAADHGESSGAGVCVDETQVDLRQGRVALTNRGYAMLPSFFEAHRGRGYPNALVNVGACRSLYNGSLASALYGSGAAVVTGFTGYVDSAWARDQVGGFFDHLPTTLDGGGGGDIVANWFEPAEDPANAGTRWGLIGALNLDLTNAELSNGDFESGTTVGWTSTGDGRVVSKLGGTEIVSGKYTGLVSTGLGFTLETGTLEQTFCIPEDKNQIEFYWKFYSEEFREFCGTDFQDAFRAELVGRNGQTITLVDLQVDDLCYYTDGLCGDCPNPLPCDPECADTGGCYLSDDMTQCDGVYNCRCGSNYVGLQLSDVSFDKGGVYNVQWQQTIKDVRALSGTGPVTLRLFATDAADSVFDSAILVDKVRFN